MTLSPDAIVGSIFESLRSDDLAGPLADDLEKLHAEGNWTPGAIEAMVAERIRLVEEAEG